MLSTYTDLRSKENVFASNKIVDTIGEWDDFVRSLEKDSKNYVYRGVRNFSYKMYTSLQRDWDGTHPVGSYSRIKSQSFDDHWQFAQYLVNQVKNNPNLACFLSGDGIDINSMALLQHFEFPSMLIDFSYDLQVALFFMTEGMSAEYCSLYYIDGDHTYLRDCSLEDINKDGLKNIENIVVRNGLAIKNYIGMLQSIKSLPLSELKTIDYIVVKGGVNNPTVFESKELGVRYTYNITNPRMDQQKGLFFFNTTQDKPLEDLIQGHNYNIIHCVNVHKSVVSHIKNNYIPDLSKNDLYYPTRGAKSIQEIFEDLKDQNLI